ncbi:acyltransferase family protein [Lysinimonas soli]|uniref:Acyltransferase family protein n=1 Tax=Lysinimonas soli TaxID=1074233 RepID=A0ABW0NRB2_9MICO
MTQLAERQDRIAVSSELTVSPTTSPTSPSPRLTSLDGLRGVAALAVVLHHLYLIATPVLIQQDGSGIGSPDWWLSDTPLKLATAGAEAVLVFFVLSGLVVALPAIQQKGFSWAGFLGGRMIRLYLPVWASLALGTALLWLVPRDPSTVTDGSWLADSNARSTTVGSLLHQAGLTQASYEVNNVLWSLRWELAFSVLLPLFVAIAVLVRRLWWLAAAVAVVLGAVGTQTDTPALQYLPVFFLGTLLAVRLEVIREWTRRRMRRPRARLWSVGIVAGSLLMLVSGWLIRPLLPSGTLGNDLVTDGEVIGALGLVVAAIGAPFLRRRLESRGCQWLGRISFSLYLVHVPILATLAFALGDRRWWLIAVIGIPLSLLGGWLFHRAIERPSHRLAQWTAGRIATRIGHVRNLPRRVEPLEA